MKLLCLENCLRPWEDCGLVAICHSCQFPSPLHCDICCSIVCQSTLEEEKTYLIRTQKESFQSHRNVGSSMSSLQLEDLQINSLLFCALTISVVDTAKILVLFFAFNYDYWLWLLTCQMCWNFLFGFWDGRFFFFFFKDKCFEGGS
jgi:hypothetical protein